MNQTLVCRDRLLMCHAAILAFGSIPKEVLHTIDLRPWVSESLTSAAGKNLILCMNARAEIEARTDDWAPALLWHLQVLYCMMHIPLLDQSP